MQVSFAISSWSCKVNLTLDPLDVGSIGIVVANVEIGAFLIFGCLSTFHPLLRRHGSPAAEGFSHSESFHIESFDTVRSEPKSGSEQLSYRHHE
jgi:hypothetical protein